jgi:hypothetical protein
MQLQDIRSEVRIRGGLATSDTALSDSVLNTLINSALRTVTTMYDWPWLVAQSTPTETTAGTAAYTIATNFRKIQSIYVGPDDSDPPVRKLRYKTPPDVLRFRRKDGRPAYYTYHQGQLLLAPTPDATYDIDIYYYSYEAVLSSDTDAPLLPDWAMEMLFEYTLVLAGRRLRDGEMAAMHAQAFSTAMATVIDEIRGTKEWALPRHRQDTFGA